MLYINIILSFPIVNGCGRDTMSTISLYATSSAFQVARVCYIIYANIQFPIYNVPTNAFE